MPAGTGAPVSGRSAGGLGLSDKRRGHASGSLAARPMARFNRPSALEHRTQPQRAQSHLDHYQRVRCCIASAKSKACSRAAVVLVVSFQAMSQLRAIYGRDEATTLLSCPSTKLIMRTDEPETPSGAAAKWCARSQPRSQSAQPPPRELRDGFSLQPRRTTEPAVSAGGIQKLEALTGYIAHRPRPGEVRNSATCSRSNGGAISSQRTDLGQVATVIEAAGKLRRRHERGDGAKRLHGAPPSRQQGRGR